MKTIRIRATSKEAMDRIEANNKSLAMSLAKKIAPFVKEGEVSLDFDRYGDTEGVLSLRVKVTN